MKANAFGAGGPAEGKKIEKNLEREDQLKK
jgi:hypothetical protein